MQRSLRHCGIWSIWSGFRILTEVSLWQDAAATGTAAAAATWGFGAFLSSKTISSNGLFYAHSFLTFWFTRLFLRMCCKTNLFFKLIEIVQIHAFLSSAQTLWSVTYPHDFPSSVYLTSYKTVSQGTSWSDFLFWMAKVAGQNHSPQWVESFDGLNVYWTGLKGAKIFSFSLSLSLFPCFLFPPSPLFSHYPGN